MDSAKKEAKSKSSTPGTTQKNFLLVAGVVLLISVAAGGAFLNQQANKAPSQPGSSASGNPSVVSQAPLQMQYFDLNSIPLTLQNSDAVYTLNEHTISSTLASDDDDLSQLNSLNPQEDSQGL